MSYSQNKKIPKPEYIIKKEFNRILDKSNVKGVILIYDSEKNMFYSNSFMGAKETCLPASTFKIPNTIIGLETGFIENEHSKFKWNGEKRALSIWEKDLNLKEAFQKSCVPCYQELARKIGVQRMNNYLQKIQFGNMDVNSETIDRFWLVGNSKISPFQEIDFLKRFYEEELQISATTTKIVKNILKINSSKEYTLSGKTGLAIIDNKEVGWFVGYVETQKRVYYFATKITSKAEMVRENFTSIRKKATILALEELEIINEQKR